VISVVMATYNSAHWLARSIPSVLGQTFRDFELIVVDDGSTDNTQKLLASIPDARLRSIRKDHSGIGETVNVGLEVARFVAVARMDADDVCLPHRFERQIAFLNTHPNVVAVGSATILIDDRDRVIREVHFPTDPAAIARRIQKGAIPFPNSSMMFRRDAVAAIGNYNGAFSPAEDVEMWLRLLRVGDFACIDEPLMMLRVHGGSTTASRRGPDVRAFSMSALALHRIHHDPGRVAAISQQQSFAARISTVDQLLNSWYRFRDWRERTGQLVRSVFAGEISALKQGFPVNVLYALLGLFEPVARRLALRRVENYWSQAQ
jgi:glycosyltransferase involved in cell wall biosynthesis